MKENSTYYTTASDFKSEFVEMFGNPILNDKGWKVFEPIGNNTTIVLGTTPISNEPKYWNGNIKWITPAEINENSYYIYDTERHITEEGLKSVNLTLLPYRSVLFSTRAPIGKVAIVGSPMYCNQGFKNFICSNNINPIFLFYTLKYNKDYLISLGTGTTFKELSKKTVEGLKIAVPDIDLQNRFEEIYNQADKSAFELKKSFAAKDGVIKSMVNENGGNKIKNIYYFCILIHRKLDSWKTIMKPSTISCLMQRMKSLSSKKQKTI